MSTGMGVRDRRDADDPDAGSASQNAVPMDQLKATVEELVSKALEGTSTQASAEQPSGSGVKGGKMSPRRTRGIPGAPAGVHFPLKTLTDGDSSQ